VKNPARPTASPSRRLITGRARTFVVGLLPTIALFLVVRVALAEAYRIPSGSMVPTLLVGDWLFVNKLRFGPHIPFSSINLPGYAEPKRGDVVVFVSPPQDPAIRIGPDEVTPVLVKRIAGMAGDTMAMRKGQLFVNGVAAAPTNGPDSASTEWTDSPNPVLAWQHRVEAHGSRFGDAPAAPTVHDWGPLVVPPGHFFMLGDNREN
jgi:signal peptidase I